jgi:hypothetical protein
MAAAVLPSCSSQPTPQSIYDPAKHYAAFLVLNNPNSANVLDSVKGKSVGDGYEIGPVEYYAAGTTDFETAIKKLTPSKQITVLYVVANMMDVPNIQKGIAKVAFKGEVRYMPVTKPVNQ